MGIIAITNQKGGTGNMTTAINLAAALGELGRQVLVVDLETQANATLHAGLMPEEQERTIWSVMKQAVEQPEVDVVEREGAVQQSIRCKGQSSADYGGSSPDREGGGRSDGRTKAGAPTAGARVRVPGVRPSTVSGHSACEQGRAGCSTATTRPSTGYRKRHGA